MITRIKVLTVLGAVALILGLAASPAAAGSVSFSKSFSGSATPTPTGKACRPSAGAPATGTLTVTQSASTGSKPGYYNARAGTGAWLGHKIVSTGSGSGSWVSVNYAYYQLYNRLQIPAAGFTSGTYSGLGTCGNA